MSAPRSTVRLLLVPLVLLCALAACGRPAPPGPAPISWLRVALVDSVAWDNELTQGFLQRVEVRHGDRLDTIPGVLTATLPAIGPDGRVHGIAFEQDVPVHGFRWEPGAGRPERISLPAGVRSPFAAPALSPDARHLAYVSVPGDNTARAVVRTWPEGRVLARGPEATVPGTDAAMNAARWIDSDLYEVLVDLVSGRWQRVRGSVSARTMQVDTVAPPAPAPPSAAAPSPTPNL